MCIYLAEGQLSKFYADMWLPTLVASDIPFVVIARSRSIFYHIRECWSDVDVIYARSGIDVERGVRSLPELRCVLYPANAGKNIHVLRFNHLRHIFIGHGDSDKAASAHKFFRAYDEIWVAGQAHIDRFSAAGFDTAHLVFEKVGRPGLSEAVAHVPRHEFRFTRKLRLGYLPTWEGFFDEQNYTSARLSAEMIAALQKLVPDLSVEAKLHPRTGSRDRSLAQIEKKLLNTQRDLGIDISISPRSRPISALFDRVDIFVCDVSAAITECLAANKPILVYVPVQSNLRYTKSRMGIEEYCYLFSNIEEFRAIVEKVLEHGDYLYERRQDAREYILGIKETVEGRFIDCLRDRSR